MKNEAFDKKIKPLLLYIGTIGAIIMTICYIITVFILVFGFQVHQEHLKQSIIFAVTNGIVGFLIMQMLKIQGVDFAKNENKELIENYNKLVLNQVKFKKVKFYSIKWYWFKSVIIDIISKVSMVVFTSFSLIYIVIEGSQDYSLLLLALVNLLMFICFGLLALVNSYDWYNNNHVNFMKHQIELKGENKNVN